MGKCGDASNVSDYHPNGSCSNPYAPTCFFYNVKKYFSHRTMRVRLKIKIKVKIKKVHMHEKKKEEEE